MPEKAADLDAIRQVFRVALVKPFADWQPHVNEHQHAAQHVQSVQTSDREITGEICAVRRQKHRRPLDVFFLDRRDLVCDGQRQKVRPIHHWIVWVGIHRIECNFVFLCVLAVQVAGDFDSRFHPFFGAPLVPQILFVLPQRVRLNVSTEVLELLRPFISEFDR